MRKRWLISLFLAALPSASTVVLAAEKSHDHGAAQPAASEAIAATGTVKGVDAAAGKLVIAHDPIPALKWPAMTMDFRLADKALASKVKAGDKIKFEMVPGEKGSYIVTAIDPAP
ncbi:MAG TPA: copper-binding protein [Candidatus Competibacter sp.]|nr:copper-binding protein [Candidatus Competibacter sp.]